MKQRLCKQCGKPLEQPPRGRPPVTHPSCRDAYMKTYWRERPAREQARRDWLAPALEPLVQLLGDPHRRGEIAQFAQWARSHAREEYSHRHQSSSTIRDLNTYFKLADLLEEIVVTSTESEAQR
ncbi:hypothetical protein [Cellulomonas biazotea]|uniref:Uncharacterized protein n=1 Tax=Cellulomonas biazotea TaxID=1709 RepID=A0A402DNE7_9CELL|nr:hypothetical protein [Cellulomonas biazotea]GCE75653.1 hypothetical protein CBZ_07090 [Cellulomonas biazotea]